LTPAFCGVASWQQSEKVECVCTTTNLPLSNDIKIVSVIQSLHGEIVSTNSDVQKRDGKTNRLETISITELLQNWQHVQNQPQMLVPKVHYNKVLLYASLKYHNNLA